MTDAEIKLHHMAYDHLEYQGRMRNLHIRQIALLKDAIDAIEIDAPDVAQRRILRVIKNLREELDLEA